MNVTYEMSWMFLLIILIVEILVISISVIVMRNLLRGRYVMPIVAAAVVVSVALLLVVRAIRFDTSLVAEGPYQSESITVPQDSTLSLRNTQTPPVPVESSVLIDPDTDLNHVSAEMPVVARKPMVSDLESSAAAVTEESPFSPAAVTPEIPAAAVMPETPFPVTVGEGKSPAALPGWVVSGLEHTKQNENNLLESSHLVFQSGLFATHEEALQDALSKAMQKLHANLMLRYPQYQINARKLTPNLLRYTASKRVYYRTIEHDFGKLLKSGKPFKQDMYRAYLEVEDSPAVRQKLLKVWKQNVGNQRIALLGGGFGLVTLLCVGVAVYLRATHDSATIKSK